MAAVIMLDHAEVEASVYGNKYQDARVTSLGDMIKILTWQVPADGGQARMREIDKLIDAEWKTDSSGSIIATGISNGLLEQGLDRADAGETWVIRPHGCESCR